jgi:hypothetical protein
MATPNLKYDFIRVLPLDLDQSDTPSRNRGSAHPIRPFPALIHINIDAILVAGLHEDCFDRLNPITFLVGELKQISR